MVPVLIFSLVIVYWDEIKHGFRMRAQSKTIPFLSMNFVGREDALRDLMARVNFDSTETRIIGITGSPGFGKSTLAIQLAHRLIDQGVYVHYVDMTEFPNENVELVMAEKILKSSDIMAKTITFDRLLRWSRERAGHTLLILDNCDNVLHAQKDKLQNAIVQIVQASTSVKVIMTSREIALHVEHYTWYKVYELSPRASLSLLDKKIPNLKIAIEEKKKIAELTGNVPLALHIVGALLNLPDPPKPSSIIEELKSNPVITLSPTELPLKLRINASISLSYYYLDDNLKRVAHFLALFPGSFHKDAVLGIFKRYLDSKRTSESILLGQRELRALVERSLLEYNERTERYQYHRLIRDFLTTENTSVDTDFIDAFRNLFSSILYQKTVDFNHKYVDSLRFLDTERHNIHSLLQDLNKPASIPRYPLLLIVESVTLAIDASYLTCRFTSKDLIAFLSQTEDYLAINVVKFQDRTRVIQTEIKDISGRSRTLKEYYQRIYIQLTITFSNLLTELHDEQYATEFMEHRKHIVDTLSEQIEENVKGSSSNRNLDLTQNLDSVPLSPKAIHRRFYIYLGNHYLAQDQHSKVIQCQLRIIKDARECESANCTYREIGLMHYNGGNFDEALKFLDLSLDNEDNSPLLKMMILVEVSSILKLTNNYSQFNLSQLIDICHEVVSLEDQVLFNNWKLIVKAITIVNKAGRNVFFLEEKLFHIISTFTTEFQLQPKDALDFLRLIEKNNNHTKTVMWGSLLLKPFKNYSNFSKEEQINVLNIRLVTSLTYFKTFHFLKALDGMEQIYTTIANVNSRDMNLEGVHDTTCFYLIPRIKYLYPCYQSKLWPMANWLYRVYLFEFPIKIAYLTFIIPFNLQTTRGKENMNNNKQLSHSRSRAVSVGDSTSYPIQIVNDVIVTAGTELKHIVMSVYTILWPYLWLVVRVIFFILNILSVCIRLWILLALFFTYIGITLLVFASSLSHKVEAALFNTLQDPTTSQLRVYCLVLLSELTIFGIKVIAMLLKLFNNDWGVIWLCIYLVIFRNNLANVKPSFAKNYSDTCLLRLYFSWAWLIAKGFIQNRLRIIFFNIHVLLILFHLLFALIT